MSENHAIEVEIKSLLGSATSAKLLIDKIFDRDNNAKLIKKSEQLNHYFLIGDLAKLLTKIEQFCTQEETVKLRKIIQEGKKHSIRTRQANNDVILVVKATLDETTSENGTARLEYEITFPHITLEELDQTLLDAHFAYQAKWSRAREEYQYKDMIVCIDKNAGYGYLAEFEKVVLEPHLFESIKKEIREEMKSLGVEELSQDRLERMFKHYNENWEKYYGTEETFTIM